MIRADIKSMTFQELSQHMQELNAPSFRTKQIFSWLHEKGVCSFDEMTNLPAAFRSQLSQQFEIRCCEIARRQVSKLDGTVKYLFELFDGELVESVLMKYKYGYTLCVSTQAGCKMGCAFCASTIAGFVRSLTASEILSQIHAAQKDMNIRVSHVVLMGMGEPLDNYDNVLCFLELVNSPDGLNIGMRNISLSTCGIVPKIYDLAQKQLQLTLSVSLHAPNDEIRSRIMPINNKYPIDTLLKACNEYIKATNRRISFEYTMIDGVNDSEQCARELASRLRTMLCHVNLIPVNTVSERSYTHSEDDTLIRFEKVLSENGINTTVRRTLGSDIDASCGQLRLRTIKNGDKKEEMKK